MKWLQTIGAATLLTAFVVPVWAAENTHRLAYSKRMGVEILVPFKTGAQWCQNPLQLRIISDAPGFFKTSAFPTLMARLGVVLGKECPTAQLVTIRGIARKNGTQIYTGTAEAQTAWLPKTKKDSANAMTPPVASNQSSGSTAYSGTPKSSPQSTLPKITKPTATWVGEWKGRMSCPNRSSWQIRISIAEADPKSDKAKGVIQMGEDESVPSKFLRRWIFSGDLNFRAGRFKFYDRDWIAKPQRGGATDFSGAAELNSLRMAAKSDFSDCSNKFELTKLSDVPETARRVAAQKEWRRVIINKYENMPQPHRVVGKQFGEALRVPQCAAMEAWANSFGPLEARVKIHPKNQAGLLKHFTDEITIRTFGKAAYFWTENERRKINQRVRECSKKSQAPIRDVFWDSASEDILKNASEAWQQLLVNVLHSISWGDDPMRQYLQAAKYDTAGKIASAWGNRRWFLNNLVYQDAVVVSKIVQEIKSGLLEGVVTDAKLVFNRGIPKGVAGLDLINIKLVDLKNTFAKILPESAWKKIETASVAEKENIGSSLIAQKIDEIKALEPSLSGLSRVESEVSILQTKLGEANKLAQKDLDAAREAYQSKARILAIEQEMAKIAEFPSTLVGIQKLKTHRKQVMVIVGDTPPLPELKTYADAVDDYIRKAAQPVWAKKKAELDALPVEWRSLGAASAVVNDFTNVFNGLPESKIAKEHESATLTRILGGLSADVIKTINESSWSWDQIPSFMKHAQGLAKPFKGYKADEWVKKIMDAARTQADAILAKDLKKFADNLEAHKKTREQQRVLERLVNNMENHVQDFPGYKAYITLTHKAVREIQSVVCSEPIKRVNLGRKTKGLLILVGEEEMSLQDFLCELDAGGIQVAKFDEPGFFGDKIYKLQTFDLLNKQISNFSMVLAEARPGVKMLVATQVGDATTSKSIGTKEWADTASSMVARGQVASGIGLTKWCQLFKNKPRQARAALSEGDLKYREKLQKGLRQKLFSYSREKELCGQLS